MGNGVTKKIALFTLTIVVLSGCGGADSISETITDVIDSVNEDSSANEQDAIEVITDVADTNAQEINTETVTTTPVDIELAAIITQFSLARSPTNNRQLPEITDPIAQLGKKLFFSKSLGGAMDTACASCHHPSLGGADQLSMPIGVEAINHEVLGIGRVNASGLPVVPRNSPTIFNVGLWDSGLFWDSRVESINKEPLQNGAASGISTPNSGFDVVDENAGVNLVASQAKFPVTSNDEMKTSTFEDGSSNQQILHHLAARIGDYQEGSAELSLNLWLAEFQAAFDSDADSETLITFENISFAIGEYERSMIFVNSPWRNYLEGDIGALSEQQKRGALLFFKGPQEDGAGCGACHSGPILSDGLHHTVGFPQIGTGKGNGENFDDDFGRENVTADEEDRYRFRTPSLLNIAVTAPYGHAGSYGSLEQVVRHYDNPRREATNYTENADWCELRQLQDVADCQGLYINAQQNTQLALDKLRREQQDRTSQLAPVRLNNNNVSELVAFLNSLTDPCVTSRECLSPWIAEGNEDNPDDNLLIATDINGNAL